MKRVSKMSQQLGISQTSGGLRSLLTREYLILTLLLWLLADLPCGLNEIET